MNEYRNISLNYDNMSCFMTIDGTFHVVCSRIRYDLLSTLSFVLHHSLRNQSCICCCYTFDRIPYHLVCQFHSLGMSEVHSWGWLSLHTLEPTYRRGCKWRSPQHRIDMLHCYWQGHKFRLQRFGFRYKRLIL